MVVVKVVTLGRAAEQRHLFIVHHFLLIATSVVIISIKRLLLLCDPLDDTRDLVLLVVGKCGSTLYILEGVLHDCDLVVGIKAFVRRSGTYPQQGSVLS